MKIDNIEWGNPEYSWDAIGKAENRIKLLERNVADLETNLKKTVDYLDAFIKATVESNKAVKDLLTDLVQHAQ